MALALLLVEDDRELADTLAADLRRLASDVTIAHDGREALAVLGRERFDAVILDRMMPRADGMSVIEQMRDAGMTMPVVMLTALTRASDKIEGLNAGADDYVAKPADAEELLARIGAIVRGRGWSAPGADTVRAGDITVSLAACRAWRGDRPIELGRLEVKLLAEFVRNAGAVLTRAMLVERVWDLDFDPRSNIVDAYVMRLRRKLAEAGGDDPIRTVRGVGYAMRG